MYHAACKVEFQPFNRSYSQLTFFIFFFKFFELENKVTTIKTKWHDSEQFDQGAWSALWRGDSERSGET